MSKQTGLGDNLYIGGIDVSGDTQQLGRIGGGISAHDVTGINKSAVERIGGLRDGGIDWTSFFNDATGQAHAKLKLLPRTDEVVSYFRGTVLGSPAASHIGKQINYDLNRAENGDLTLPLSTVANGFGLDWGVQLTAGRDTLSSAGAGTGVDLGANTDFGLQAYLHVFAITGTSATVAIQDSDDDGTDPYANVTGAVFAAASAAGAQRIQTSRTEDVKQWLRVNVTGTFSALDFAVVVVKNEQEVLF